MFQGRPSKDWLGWAKAEVPVATRSSKVKVANATADLGKVLMHFIFARLKTDLYRPKFVGLARSLPAAVYSNQQLVAISFIEWPRSTSAVLTHLLAVGNPRRLPGP